MEIEIRKENLRNEIAALEKESSRLQSYRIEKTTIGNYNDGGDIVDKKNDELVRTGTNTQIDNINAKLAQKRAELESLESFDRAPVTMGQNISMDYGVDVISMQEENNKSDKIDRQNEKMDEDYRKNTFKQVKNMYKQAKGRSFERFMDFISGKRPKWKKISKFSQEQLDYLIKTYQGETKFRQDSISHIRKLNLSLAEERKRVNASNWVDFTNLLRKEELLKQSMEIENKKGNHR